jgi:hypothetical protein
MEQLTIFLGWQALLVALVASAFTELTKRVINILLAVKDDSDGRLTMLERIGDEIRRETVFINTILMPALPLLFGALGAWALPHPEEMIEYMKAHALPSWKMHAAYAVWGAICGLFSGWLFDRLRTTIMAVAAKKAGNEEG